MCPALRAAAPSGRTPWPPPHLARPGAPVTLSADLSRLSAKEREMVGLFIEASAIMDELFWRQAYPGDRGALLEDPPVAGIAGEHQVEQVVVAGEQRAGAQGGEVVAAALRLEDRGRVRSLAELGVVFLLFEIGLELPFERVRHAWRDALSAGALQVVLTFSLVAAGAAALGAAVPVALVLGALVAMSSTALVIGYPD